jgi:flagellar hook-associated protein 1 FlgK
MVAGLSLALNTSAQTLQNTELEIATSSNNISNASSTGYSCQTAVQTSNPEIMTASGWVGAGASVTQITQARDSFLEQKLMNATTDDSQYTSLASELTSIQASCSDTGNTGISQALGNFFDSWSTLAQNTTSLSGQSNVYSAAQSLANTIQSTYNQLNQYAVTDIPGQLQNTVTQANSLIDQIAQLNVAIAQSETPDAQANTLRDERYQAMDSLAQLIPVSFSQDPTTGTFTVNTTDANGPLTIVSGGTATHISTASTITGGQFGGLTAAGADLNGYMSQLNGFASTLISQVNYIATTSGAADVFTGTDASSITASTTFLKGLTSSQLSALSQSMSDLQNTNVTFPDTSNATLQQYLSNFQETVGNDVQSANNNQTFCDSLKSELQKQQQSVSGVSVDEELVKIINYQQIYEAAAKVVQTANTLMDAIMNVIQ